MIEQNDILFPINEQIENFLKDKTIVFFGAKNNNFQTPKIATKEKDFENFEDFPNLFKKLTIEMKGYEQRDWQIYNFIFPKGELSEEEEKELEEICKNFFTQTNICVLVFEEEEKTFENKIFSRKDFVQSFCFDFNEAPNIEEIWEEVKDNFTLEDGIEIILPYEMKYK